MLVSPFVAPVGGACTVARRRVYSGNIAHYGAAMRVVLISTYELGHQPFGLASPAAWLERAGAQVVCRDLAIQPFDPDIVADAALVAFYLPMHTATRLAGEVIARVRAINPHAHLCAYGLYAPLNESWLRAHGISTILGGEFEAGLLALYQRLSTHPSTLPPSTQPEPRISLAKQAFLPPARHALPALQSYAYLALGPGQQRTAGYTEASRGCKHSCRHCPIVPVYGGHFRVVQPAIVLEDIRGQVAAGAQHITFGDPDFFNGPGHAIPLVQALHAEFPALTYDVTIKIEHLLRHAALLPALRATGCLFVTSAVEAADDAILARFAKRHTRADFVRAAGLLREVGLALNPTFVTFTPWTTRQTYIELLELIAELGLIEHVAPIQYAIRLLIPAQSRLLELADVRALVQPFDQAALVYPWAHPDPSIDTLYRQVLRAVKVRRNTRHEHFAEVWRLAQATLGAPPNERMQRELARRTDWRPIPHMSEPWYC